MTTLSAPDEIVAEPRRECPYIGLQPYGESDSEYFFGRDADRDLIVANLMASRLTVLYGPSGVGKSSLLQAAIAPYLRHSVGGALSYVASRRAVVVYQSSWRDDPAREIGGSLRAALSGGLDGADQSPSGEPLPDRMSVELVREVSSRLDADVYLLCDQFEEQALYQSDERSEEFALELGQIVTTPGLRANVLLGIREDALAKLDRLDPYLPDLFGNSLRLDHLSARGARDAIEMPLERYAAGDQERSMGIEPSLVARLLYELRTGHVVVADARGLTGGPNQTIETPFLQLVMTKLWSAEAERGSRILRESTLLELGGSSRIVRTHLDDVMGHLTEEQRVLAADVFRYLVTPSGAKIAHTATDLASYAGLTETGALNEMLEELASGRERILRPVPAPVDQPGPPRFEIFHDVLAPAVLDWRRRYVAERVEKQHRRTRRRLRRSRVLSAVLALLLVAAISAFVYSRRISDQAEAGRRLAQYERLLPSDPAAALHDALGAWHKRSSPEAEAAVRTAMAVNGPTQVLRGHSGIVEMSQFSPDGRTVVTAGDDGTSRLFDAATGRQRTVLTGGGNDDHAALTWAAFSPDGSLVATTADTGVVRVYAAATGAVVGTFAQIRSEVQAAWLGQGGRQRLLISSTGGAFRPAVLWDPRTNAVMVRYGNAESGAFDASASASGRQVVAVDADATITVWDAASGAVLSHSPPVGSDDVTDEAVNRQAAVPRFVGADGDRIAVLGRSSATRYFWEFMLWNWKTHATDVIGSDARARSALDLAVSPDGKSVAMVQDKEVVVYDADSAGSADLVGLTADLADGIDSVQFSPNGHWLLTANVNGHASVWPARDFVSRPVADFAGHQGAVIQASFDPADPARLTTAGLDGTARIWTFASRSDLQPSTYGWVMDAEASQDGKYVVTAQDTGHYDVWDAATRKRLGGDSIWQSTFGGLMLSASFLPDDERVVTATKGDRQPRLWSWRTGDEGTQLHALTDHWITSAAALDQDGTRVVAGDNDNRVIEWDVKSGQIIDETAGDLHGSITAVAYVPASKAILVGSTDGSLRTWESGQLSSASSRTFVTAGSAAVLAVAASRDGRWIASVDSDHEIRIWTADGHLQQTIAGPPTTASALAFSPDGRQLAVAAADAAVHVYDWARGESLGEIQPQADMLNSVRYLDDTRLLTGSDDGTASIYQCTTCGPFSTVLAQAEQLDRSYR